jgi:hypothetical protein
MRLGVMAPLLAASAVLGCSLLSGLRKPPRAPPAEAEKVAFSLYTPASTTKLDALRVRAAAMALADYLPEPEAAVSCQDRVESYDVTTWMAESASPDAGCPDGDADAELMSGITCETLYGTPGLVYVEIQLRPGACDDGGEVVLDEGATYAIDVKQWRIAAAHR